jgi:hypothetical protein
LISNYNKRLEQDMGYFRHPRTTQERRHATGLEIDGREFHQDIGVAIRPRHGRGDSMASARDDMRVAARSDRNWKRFRRTRWR